LRIRITAGYKYTEKNESKKAEMKEKKQTQKLTNKTQASPFLETALSLFFINLYTNQKEQKRGLRFTITAGTSDSVNSDNHLSFLLLFRTVL